MIWRLKSDIDMEFTRGQLINCWFSPGLRGSVLEFGGHRNASGGEAITSLSYLPNECRLSHLSSYRYDSSFSGRDPGQIIYRSGPKGSKGLVIRDSQDIPFKEDSVFHKSLTSKLLSNICQISNKLKSAVLTAAR